MGAHHTINYNENTNWIESVLEITKGKGVNLVVDVIGGNHLNESLRCLQSEGIISMIGVMNGIMGNIDTGMVMSKAAKIKGVKWVLPKCTKECFTLWRFIKLSP